MCIKGGNACECCIICCFDVVNNYKGECVLILLEIIHMSKFKPGTAESGDFDYGGNNGAGVDDMLITHNCLDRYFLA